MGEELKACPFCGGKASHAKDMDTDVGGYFYYIKCAKCGAKSPERYARDTCPVFYAALRDLWNTRALTVQDAAKVLLADNGGFMRTDAKMAFVKAYLARHGGTVMPAALNDGWNAALRAIGGET